MRSRGPLRHRSRGNIGELMAIGLYIVALTWILTVFLHTVSLIQKKSEISQLLRERMLQMETVGFLTDEALSDLTGELETAGLTDVYFEDTTRARVPYGARITLEISGKLEGQVTIHETRTSTAKYR